jgi:hypothetical protein
MSTVFTATFRCTPVINLKSTLILWINSGKRFKKPTRIPYFIGYVGGMNEESSFLQDPRSSTMDITS